MTMDLNERIFYYFNELTKIPHGSRNEKQLSDWLVQFAKDHGLRWIQDEMNNVIIYKAGTAGLEKAGAVILQAHMDMVCEKEAGVDFDFETQALNTYVEDGWLKAPGVGDDTANVALLMVITRYLLEQKCPPKQGVLIVLNAGEEGLGNLKGCRRLMQDYADKLSEVYSFDGSYKGYVNKAVGSVRYRVEVKTEGGHSYGAFGNRNAIRVLASLIDALYSVKVPQGGKTTYNVGTIEGGTSVNTIAQQASMLFEFRSDVREHLDQMRGMFDSLIDAYRKMGVEVNVEILGERPCMGEIDQEKQRTIEKKVEDLIERRIGVRPEGHSGSTDCNIPFSLGINSLCFGGYLGEGAHTREEKIEKASLLPGLGVMMEFVLNYFL